MNAWEYEASEGSDRGGGGGIGLGSAPPARRWSYRHVTLCAGAASLDSRDPLCQIRSVCFISSVTFLLYNYLYLETLVNTK